MTCRLTKGPGLEGSGSDQELPGAGARKCQKKTMFEKQTGVWNRCRLPPDLQGLDALVNTFGGLLGSPGILGPLAPMPLCEAAELSWRCVYSPRSGGVAILGVRVCVDTRGHRLSHTARRPSVRPSARRPSTHLSGLIIPQQATVWPGHPLVWPGKATSGPQAPKLDHLFVVLPHHAISGPKIGS